MKAKESGFSLIEMMIAMGLMGLMAAFMMSIAKIGLTGQRNVAAMDDARNLTGEMAILLMNPTACLNTFGGGNPVAAGGTSVSQIKSATNTVVYRLNIIYGNKILRLTGVTLGGVGTQPKMNLQRYTASAATQGLALLEANWTKIGDKSGAAVLSRFFYVNVTLDGTNKITACNAVGGLAGEIWKRSPIDSNKIYYSEGDVGVGTSDPKTKLDVAGAVRPGDQNQATACDAATEGSQRYNRSTHTMEYCGHYAGPPVTFQWTALGGAQYEDFVNPTKFIGGTNRLLCLNGSSGGASSLPEGVTTANQFCIEQPGKNFKFGQIMEAVSDAADYAYYTSSSAGWGYSICYTRGIRVRCFR